MGWEIPVFLWNKRIYNKANFTNFSPHFLGIYSSSNPVIAPVDWHHADDASDEIWTFLKVSLGNVKIAFMVQVEKLEKQIYFVFSAAIRFETSWAVLFGYLATLRNNRCFKWWYFSEINCYFNENLLCGEHFIFVSFICCFHGRFTHVVIVEWKRWTLRLTSKEENKNREEKKEGTWRESNRSHTVFKTTNALATGLHVRRIHN